METYSESRSESHQQSEGEKQNNSTQLQINKRERFKIERDQRHGKPIVRIVRLKPGADGGERPAGPALEFSARHLPGVIAMLQALQISEAS
jgi:hypothetical protein